MSDKILLGGLLENTRVTTEFMGNHPYFKVSSYIEVNFSDEDLAFLDTPDNQEVMLLVSNNRFLFKRQWSALTNDESILHNDYVSMLAIFGYRYYNIKDFYTNLSVLNTNSLNEILRPYPRYRRLID